MKKSSKNDKKVLAELKLVFYPNYDIRKDDYTDFMGYPFDDRNFPTIHHIVKASVLREQNVSDAATFDNSACLGDLSHVSLHYIERFDKELYDDWNRLFLMINHSRKELTKQDISLFKGLQDRSIMVLEQHRDELMQGHHAKKTRKKI